MYQLTKEERTAYLRRIGVTAPEAPTKEFLFELHKAHVKHLSWQCIDIFAGKPPGIELAESVQLVVSGRSGYCFHLNGAFSALLHSLGYRVFWHRGGVQPLGQEPRINSFHLGLTVDLADENKEPDRWLVDVGLGDMPYEPLPLRFGSYEQAPLRYELTSSGVAADGWRLVHDPRASFAGVDYAPDILADLAEFKPKHEFYSLSPESPWINVFLIRHRHETGSNELRGCIWTKHRHDGVEKTEISTFAQWLELLGDVFGEQLIAYSELEKRDLWNKVRTAHDQWKRTKAMTN